MPLQLPHPFLGPKGHPVEGGASRPCGAGGGLLVQGLPAGPVVSPDL